ncbi:MAG TPA: DUF1990 domain-containing protein [Blastocatellia bacterium]|nr:DUF1990 domain-containing protein [Blastocatellia bacterium]
MLVMRKPGERELSAFISAQEDKPFSYHPPGITRDPPASGFNVDHTHARLGSGHRSFEAARESIRKWKMFEIDWLHLFSRDAPIEPGSTVAVVVRHLGFWSMNPCRIVYTVEEGGEREKYGFAYGTLQGHVELGEERFTVEWDRRDDSVWYDILAVSRPGPLAALGYPYARRMQKRFAQDSERAMVRSVSGANEIMK